MAETNETAKTRKERARSTDVVIGALIERVDVLRAFDTKESPLTPHIDRLNELIDELRRSLLKKGSKEESE